MKTYFKIKHNKEKIVKLITILFLLSLSIAAYEVDGVDFNFKPEAQFFDQLTVDLRDEMPDHIPFSNIQIDDEGDLHLKLLDGHINLAAIKPNLFSVEPLPKNQVRIRWNFKAVTGQFNVRADWKVDIFGVIIRKHEVFHISARDIPQGESVFQVQFEDGKFKLKLVENRGFAFNHISVQSADDDIVTWILERIDSRVRDVLNEEIQDYFAGPKFSAKFQEMVEEDLASLEKLKIHVSDYATKLQARFNHFALDDKGVEFKLDTQFLEPQSKVHVCARELARSMGIAGNQKSLNKENQSILLENRNPGTVKVSYSFVESIVDNMAIYETDEDNDGYPDEPLFCFGYDDPDHSGKIEEVEFDILGKTKKLNVKFWAYPLERPTYNYKIEKEGAEGEAHHKIIATMRAKVKFGNTYGYPKVLFKNDTISAKATIEFQLAVVPGKGLQAIPLSFALNDIDGKVYYKAKKFIPKIRVPFKFIKKKIEEELLVELRDSLAEKIIIDEVIPALSFSIKIKDYQLRTDGHEMDFNVLYQ